ncbi:uncharacterized protein CANTADRAFT_57357 [Suhomyces tanzawaensis NRRL Y-17324]|uniref:Ribosome biogenesis protein NSA1 n=1 Tax=Suhomyces tanzawaensis NRRL Y-17324 TaxID=984487 RepID=A0A1E4SBZ7_9ASCO|nr:uncharacterized protein CANTADRAFT_57357 [Suhomyces tanzawaensis NRRL Y-17324]ODV76912.1 hypothetical protein CANTADRAFT_57357 [Suhomyces tanzawaensis NRRL Y-17324]
MNDHDEIVRLGFLSDQYLYSCSNEGKLVIRDLINDDANESYKVYLLHNPVLDIQLKVSSHNDNRIVIACAGKNSELKMYEVNLESSSDTSEHIWGVAGPRGNRDFSVIQNSNLRSTIDLNYTSSIPRPLRRSYTNLNLRAFITATSSAANSYTDRQVNALSPIWTSNTSYQKFLFLAAPSESISNWFVSVCILDDYIVTGSQFGKVMIYNIFEDTFPIHTLEVSQFPIRYLAKFGSSNHLIYSDSISKVGILDMNTFKVIKLYDHLEIGPLSYLNVVLPNLSTKRRKQRKLSIDGLRFDPVYLICTKIDKSLAMYKLFDDGTSELLLNVDLGTFIPSMALLKANEYEAFNSMFGNVQDDLVSDVESVEEALEASKKRKLLADVLTVAGRIPVQPLHNPETQTDNDDNDDGKGDKDGLNAGVKSMRIG